MKEKEGGCIKVRSIERTTSQGEARYAPTKTGFIGCIQKKLGHRGQGTKAVRSVRSVKGDEE
jgi:hypothetical protein